MSEGYGHIAGAGPDGADAFGLAQDVGQVADASGFLDNAHQQQVAVGVDGPDVGGVIVFGWRQAPVAGGDAIPPAALAGRLKVGGAGDLGIARRPHRRLRALHRVQVRQNQAVHAGVQSLLDDPLVLLAGVGRDADDRRRVGLQAAGGGDALAVEQELERGAQVVERQPLVFHLNHQQVVIGIGEIGHFVQVAVPD